MPRKTPPQFLEIHPGQSVPGLADAQRAAIHATAYDLAATIRALLEAGQLVNINGKIIPRENHARIHSPALHPARW